MRPAAIIAALVAACARQPCRSASALKVDALRDEASCKLFSKRGLLLSCDVHPVTQKSDTDSLLRVTVLTELGMAHYVEDIKAHGDGASVYVVTSALPKFVELVLPHVSSRFKLVTGDSIASPIAALGVEGFARLANDTRLIKWFAQNVNGEESVAKIVPLPLGLDYHTYKNRTQTPPEVQESQLMAKVKASPPFKDRKYRVSFTGSKSTDRRSGIMSQLKHQSGFVEIGELGPRESFWENLGRFKWVASPPGTGVDCHRTWEVLVMGSIPLVSNKLHKLYEDNGFNVVEVDDIQWGQLAGPEMQKKFTAALRRHQDGIPEAMYLKYWLDKIKNAN